MTARGRSCRRTRRQICERFSDVEGPACEVHGSDGTSIIVAKAHTRRLTPQAEYIVPRTEEEEANDRRGRKHVFLNAPSITALIVDYIASECSSRLCCCIFWRKVLFPHYGRTNGLSTYILGIMSILARSTYLSLALFSAGDVVGVEQKPLMPVEMKSEEVRGRRARTSCELHLAQLFISLMTKRIRKTYVCYSQDSWRISRNGGLTYLQLTRGAARYVAADLLFFLALLQNVLRTSSALIPRMRRTQS